MDITEVKIRKYENNATKGFASVTFDDALVITGLTILERFVRFYATDKRQGC